MACIFDNRWCGDHGIGRFATEVSNRLKIVEYPSSGAPMSPLDPIRISQNLRNRVKLGTDWFLSPGYNGPLWGNVPYILTVHDLNHIDRPENSNFAKKIYYETVLRRLCLRSKGIFTVSEFSKNRIIDWSGVESSRIFNVGNGVSDAFKMDGIRWRCGAEYVLCVSNRRGHKNEPSVIKAFAAAGLDKSVKLIFTGDSSDNLAEIASACGVKDRLAFTGRVSEADLAAIYRGAKCLCFVPFYEGFGLPIVEAFASGTPVITSDTASMPEIAGNAALLVDPNCIVSISNALIDIFNDQQLRINLIDKGLKRSLDFRWDAVVERIRNAVDVINSFGDDSSVKLSW